MDRAPSNRPRYVPDTAKALEVILWLSQRQPGIDVYHLVKAAFFADKKHIEVFGRPIVGDTYNADSYGPLPKVIYGLLNHNFIEMIALGNSGPLPFEIRDKYAVYGERDPNLNRLSGSDIEALEFGLQFVADKSFDELVQITHNDPAYINAQGGQIDYRDFIPTDDPDREDKAQDLTEIAHYAVF